VNLLMPVSAVASQAFLDSHRGWGVFTSSVTYNVHRYARAAAVKYIADEIPWAERSSLTLQQRADLLGLFTVFFHHLVYAIVQDLPNADLGLPDGTTKKNLFQHMMKSNVDSIVKSLDPELADFIHEWRTGKNFDNHAAVRDNAHLRTMFRHIRNQLEKEADRDTVKAWGRNLVFNSARKRTKLSVLRDYLHAFDALQDCQAYAGAVGNCETSPIGHRAPGAFYVGAGYPAAGALSLVVESRYETNGLTQAVMANNAQNMNAVISPYLFQHRWDGKNNWYKFTDNVGAYGY